MRGCGGGCKNAWPRTFVSATMRHIQHMLPSSSAFRGGAHGGTVSDMIQGNKHGAASRGPRGAQPQGLDKTQDLFVSTGSRSACPCVHGGGPNMKTQADIQCTVTSLHTMWPCGHKLRFYINRTVL